MSHPWLKFFAFEHLPVGPMRETSRRFAVLAADLVNDPNLPPNAELRVALRKLLEAKDCAVRAHLGESL